MFIDLDSTSRRGFAGPEAASVLKQLSLHLPVTRFQCIAQTGSSLLIRLNPLEFLWLGASDSAAVIPESSACYPVRWRSSHAWFVLTGSQAPEQLAAFCDIDLAPERFPDISCTPAMLARIPVLLVRWDESDVLRLHLLVPRPHAAAIRNELNR